MNLGSFDYQIVYVSLPMKKTTLLTVLQGHWGIFLEWIGWHHCRWWWQRQQLYFNDHDHDFDYNQQHDDLDYFDHDYHDYLNDHFDHCHFDSHWWRRWRRQLRG
jgi:hypothetical protein